MKRRAGQRGDRGDSGHRKLRDLLADVDASVGGEQQVVPIDAYRTAPTAGPPAPAPAPNFAELNDELQRYLQTIADAPLLAARQPPNSVSSGTAPPDWQPLGGGFELRTDAWPSQGPSEGPAAGYGARPDEQAYALPMPDQLDRRRVSRWPVLVLGTLLTLAIFAAGAAVLLQFGAGTPKTLLSAVADMTAGLGPPKEAPPARDRTAAFAPLPVLDEPRTVATAPAAARAAPVPIASLSLTQPVRDTGFAINLDRASVPEHTRLKVRGLPDGARLSAGQAVAGGDWLVELADLGRLALSLPEDVVGTQRLVLELVSPDGAVVSAFNTTIDVRANPNAAPVPVLRKGEDEDRARKLLRRGEQLLAEGDVAAARTFFKMAAEAGDAEAAMAMGATHDPNLLSQYGVRGMKPDAVAALFWYSRALDLGSKDALDRIDQLGRK